MKQHKTANELITHVREIAKEVPVDQLGEALKKVAKSRGVAEAHLEMKFEPVDDPYYNVYRYAFFGKVPEKEAPVTLTGSLR